jgi:hypothetical protein
VRPFSWVNKQAKNRLFLSGKKFTNNKKWQILGDSRSPHQKKQRPVMNSAKCAMCKPRILEASYIIINLYYLSIFYYLSVIKKKKKCIIGRK